VSLLRLLSLPYFRRHVLRTLLTTGGIVLGVAVLVGFRAANRSVVDAFARTIDRIAGKTQLQVSAGDTGFGEEILEKVQALATVRVAVPVIEAVADRDERGADQLLVLGVDLAGDRSLRDYDLESSGDSVVDDPLVFLAQPDSLIVSRIFAANNGLGVGSTLPLSTAAGVRVFTIRGVMTTPGLSSAFGGNVAIMDVYAAQLMFGRGRKFDRIDLTVRDGRTIAECQHALQTVLGPGFETGPPAGRTQQFESMIAAYSMMVNVSSVFALFIGMFIIYNSFAIAVTERRAEIGILRALGARRAQIRRLFVYEGAVIGVIGSAGGVALGMGIAAGISGYIGTVISDVYGLPYHPDAMVASPPLLATCFVVGVLTSMAAAWIPATHAAQVDPVRALQKGNHQLLSGREHRVRMGVAAALALGSLLCESVGGSRFLFYAGYALAIAVALVVMPMLSLALARLLRPLLRLVRPVEGALAADSLIQAPRRTAASTAALMLSVALVVAFGGIARASYNSIVVWMNANLSPDFFVLPSPRVVTRSMLFPDSMAGELSVIPGVRLVEAVREARVMVSGAPVMIVATDLDSASRTNRRKAVEGDPREMYQAAAAGRAVMVSEDFAALKHLRRGDVLEIQAPSAVLRLPIAGIVIDYSDQAGTILMDRRVFQTFWHDDSANLFRVYLDPGEAPAGVRQRILDRYAGQRRVFVMTNGELRRYILTITGQWFELTSIQIVVAVFVAILGIVNTLTVSITDRRRELGVLKAVGAYHAQIRRTIWIEAITIGVIGLALGCAFGAVNLYYTLQIAQRDVVGMRLDYAFPVSTIAALVPAVLAAAFIAAIWPARAAVRGSLVEALEYE
jgi:putative ABC transport system permease protein